jgi:regulator of protease activity HflC (stomatin/prohibitin superfamily)
MKLSPREYSPIIYLTKHKLEKDFRINVFSLLILGAAIGGVIAVLSTGSGRLDVEKLTMIVSGALVAGVIILLLPFWIVDLGIIALAGIALHEVIDENFLPVYCILSAGFLLMPTLQLAQQWEKAVIFRLGRFRGLRGPGLFFMIPIIDRAIRFIDTRIRATDFRAETTLTRDTVSVNVDAIAIWMIWDAEKATLEVEDYLDAVILSAQAALRDAIGKHDLTGLLSERERLGKEIQEILDAKTNPWGVSILSIGITDIVISKELEDALSQQAQAERERQSRVILGDAEVEVAAKYVEAAKYYADNPTALQLRAMNMIYEGIRKNGTVVLLPSGAVQDMALGKVMDDVIKGKKPLGDLTGKGGGA